jgi:hypothetical protein
MASKTREHFYLMRRLFEKAQLNGGAPRYSVQVLGRSLMPQPVETYMKVGRSSDGEFIYQLCYVDDDGGEQVFCSESAKPTIQDYQGFSRTPVRVSVT